MTRVDILDANEKTMLHLEGYEVDGSPERRQHNGKSFELVRFKGAHSSEYCVYEVQNDKCNGAAELFDNGVVKLRWRMKDGIRDGKWILFHEGMVSKEGRWSDDNQPERRLIINEVGGPTMVISRNDTIIYKGGFNESYEREGYGVEYEKGVLKRRGTFRRDAMVHLCQVFVDENTMIEFDGNEEEDNMDVLSRRPVYVGGFTYNDSLRVYQRSGRGRLLSKRDGLCGELENGCKLTGGWYVARDSGVAACGRRAGDDRGGLRGVSPESLVRGGAGGSRGSLADAAAGELRAAVAAASALADDPAAEFAAERAFRRAESAAAGAHRRGERARGRGGGNGERGAVFGGFLRQAGDDQHRKRDVSTLQEVRDEGTAGAALALLRERQFRGRERVGGEGWG